MIAPMNRKLPPFVYREKTRHQRQVYYFRKGKEQRTRLPDYGSSEFDKAYTAALTQSETPKKRHAGQGSLEWLIARYRQTSTYLALSLATRKQRDNIFENVVKKSGHVAYKAISRKNIVEGREKRAKTPAQSRNFLDAMRGLFAWAGEAELIPEDPTLGVKNPKRPKSGGFAAWNDEDVARYEVHWPEGSKERVWLHVLLYTGLRRGDAIMLGRQHVRDGVATLRTEKTLMEVHLRIFPQLAATLATGPTGDLAFIVGTEGKPLTKETFGNYFRDACNAAGVKKSAHGLRKLAASRAALAGVTTSQLEAMFGWTGGTMASLYTKSANRMKLAAEGSRTYENVYAPHLEHNSPHLQKNLGKSNG